MSGRRITTISLDDETYELAKHEGNLSAFVRRALVDSSKHRRNQPVNFHNNWRADLEICVPEHPTGYCEICWPYGRPTLPDFYLWTREYRQAKLIYPYDKSQWPEPPKRSPDRRNSPHANTITKKKSSETVTNNKGIIRKIISWFFCVF